MFYPSRIPELTRDLDVTFHDKAKMEQVDEQMEQFVMECLDKELERIWNKEICGYFKLTEENFELIEADRITKDLTDLTEYQLGRWFERFTVVIVFLHKYPFTIEFKEDELLIEDMKKYINIFNRIIFGYESNYTSIRNFTTEQIYQEYFISVFLGIKYPYILQKIREHCEVIYSNEVK
jgi:hypothetical protein